ncbi:hypothetical protein [Staphylococcus shinii]|uniref:hypothetical protein n=1 Tax=Staphylococcus shinii TaxID=2912228 RepID=UPI003F562A7C
MAYEYDEFIDAIRFGLTMSDRDTTDDIWKMVDEVVNKAKAWDNYLLSVEEDAKNEFGDNEALVKHAVELNKKIFMEDE